VDSIASGFNTLRSILFPLSTNRQPLQGDCCLGVTYPPRCGGLACVAPKGAEEKLAILPDNKILMLMYG
ncbi:MAG: hypothetical protein LBK82_06155, partial [Planctomycetaceae bacterium]|nr:hypothetical protein [Planctomycetaceae bacterium]